MISSYIYILFNMKNLFFSSFFLYQILSQRKLYISYGNLASETMCLVLFTIKSRDLWCKIREIHPLDPQPHRHSMLVPRVCAPRVTRCSLGKYWSRDFFQKEAESSRQGVGNPEPYLFSLPLSSLGQIGCQGDGVSRQPGWGTQVIYDSCVEGSEI